MRKNVMLFTLIIMITLIIASVVIYMLKGYSGMRNPVIGTTTSLNVTENTTPLTSLIVYSASLFCSNVDPKAMVVFGDCILTLYVENNGTKPIVIHSLLFPSLQLRLPIEEKFEVGESKIVRRNFNLRNPVRADEMLAGVLDTSMGRVEVTFVINI